jgi:hypothetical protein
MDKSTDYMKTVKALVEKNLHLNPGSPDSEKIVEALSFSGHLAMSHSIDSYIGAMAGEGFDPVLTTQNTAGILPKCVDMMESLERRESGSKPRIEPKDTTSEPDDEGDDESSSETKD